MTRITITEQETLNWAIAKAYELIGQYIPGWSFGWSRAKGAFGYCKYMSKRVELSYFLTKTRSHKEIENTIRHEIAPALAGSKAGHGPQWRAMAIRVGADPRATSSINEATKKALIKDAKYRLVDTTTGNIVATYERFPAKVAAHTAKYFVPGRKSETLGKLKLYQTR